MSKAWGAAMSWTASAETPAALTTKRASNVPRLVWTRHPASVRWRPVTAVSRRRSAPFRTAVSARARQYSQGEQTAAEGAWRAAITASESSGSRVRACAPVRNSSPGTPLLFPRSQRASSTARSSGENAATRDPQAR